MGSQKNILQQQINHHIQKQMGMESKELKFKEVILSKNQEEQIKKNLHILEQLKKKITIYIMYQALDM